MSALEQIKKLEAQKQKLIQEATAEALKKAQDAVADLNALGHDYQLLDGRKPPKQTRGPRKSGIRQQVLDEINKHPDGISRQDLLNVLNAHDKSAEQAISNAVSALKKAEQIGGEKGIYRPL